MIEVDLIKKYGKKALGMEEHSYQKPTWRERIPEILLEIGIIVFAITLSIWLHNWQEHRHGWARERQFLLGVQQDLAADLKEMRANSLSYTKQQRGLRYFKTLTSQTLRPDSVRYHIWTLTNSTYFIANASRYSSLKSTGALGIVESEELLNQLLAYYERNTVNLTLNAQGFSDTKTKSIGPYLDLRLQPDHSNLVAVIQQTPMQNYLAHGEVIRGLLVLYHNTAQQARELRRRIGAYLEAEK